MTGLLSLPWALKIGCGFLSDSFPIGLLNALLFDFFPYIIIPSLDLTCVIIPCLALPCFIIPCLVLTYHTLPCLSLLYHRDRTHHPLPFLYVHKICETAALLSFQHYLYLILSTFSSTFLCCLRTVLLRLPVLYLFSSNYHLPLPVCDS